MNTKDRHFVGVDGIRHVVTLDTGSPVWARLKCRVTFVPWREATRDTAPPAPEPEDYRARIMR